MFTERDFETLEQAARLILDVIERHRIHEENAADRRNAFEIVENSDFGKILPFPGRIKEAKEEQEATIDAGTSAEIEQSFVEFTDKEIQQMPITFNKIITINRKCCHIRKHQSGENTTTYEIRFRRDGYDISACGKTIELAKAKMLKKMRTAKKKDKNDKTYNGVPMTFNAFAMYYFENFRREKVAAITFKADMYRYNLHIKPHFDEMRLSKITPLDCKRLLDKVKAEGKGKTADELYSLMSIIFKGAIAHGIIQRNPLDVVFHIQHETESGSALTKVEEEMLFKNMKGDNYRTAAALVLYCGLRPNELQYARIAGDFIETVNSKRKHKKTEYKKIPIIERLRPFLPEDGIFEKVNLELLREKVRLALPNHKLYDLRTTFYSRCKELGVTEHALKEFAGHSLGALGNAYTDLSDEYLLSEGKKLNLW
ncbi:MAG: hypothetical protein IJX75_03600 [Clostridia bacterium]|nr:hypothetical protein [Clostridia bacterium]